MFSKLKYFSHKQMFAELKYFWLLPHHSAWHWWVVWPAHRQGTLKHFLIFHRLSLGPTSDRQQRSRLAQAACEDQQILIGPRGQPGCPQSSVLSPQSSVFGPESSVLNPYSSVLNPQSSVPSSQSSRCASVAYIKSVNTALILQEC